MPEDFLSNYKLEEQCFKDAVVEDVFKHNKAVWPVPLSIGQPHRLYELFLDKIFDTETGKWYPKRDGEMRPVPSTTRYVPQVLIRIRTVESEFLVTKGSIIGYDAAGEEQYLWFMYPERWTKTEMSWERVPDERTKMWRRECRGPKGSTVVYSLPFNKESVNTVYQKTDKKNVQFIIKDDVTDEAMQVKGSSVDESLKLFRDSTFEDLKLAKYIPDYIKEELRKKAIADGAIKGVSSDYDRPIVAPKGTAYT